MGLLNPRGGSGSMIGFGSARFDFDANTLLVDGRPVHLELKQSLVLLKLLAEFPGVVTKEQLLEFGWPGVATGDDVLAVAVSHLRKALGDSVRSPRYIKTVAGQGYQWVMPLSARARQLARARISGEEVKPRFFSRRTLVYLGFVITVAAAIAIWHTGSGPVTEASRLVQSGDPKGWTEALALYEQAYEAGDSSTEVLLGMVDAQWRILGQNPLHLYQAREELRAWLRLALENDPDNAAIQSRLARLEFYVAWKPAAARAHYRRATELDPTNADLHLELSYLHLAMGDFEAANASLEAARSIDPKHYAREMAAWIYNMQRDYDQARLELDRLVEIRPDTPSYHVSAQSVFENSGDHEASFEHLLKVLELADYGDEDLGHARQVFGQSGLAGVYRWLLVDRGETRNIGQYQPPLAYARYAIRYGDTDAAFAYLQEALAQRQYELLWIRVDPKYDPIRNDPRFGAFVASMGMDF